MLSSLYAKLGFDCRFGECATLHFLICLVIFSKISEYLADVSPPAFENVHFCFEANVLFELIGSGKLTSLILAALLQLCFCVQCFLFRLYVLECLDFIVDVYFYDSNPFVARL